MRHAQTALFVLPLVALACKDKGPPEGEYAAVFDGIDSCAKATPSETLLPDSFTVEAWVQADEDAFAKSRPFMVWTGAFALWEDAEGTTRFSDATSDEAGASSPMNVLDGELHHVAGTWDGTATLFVDGVRVAINSNVAFGANTAGSVHVGCWGAKSVHHHGILDEVRLSGVVRYEDDFLLPTGPFENDDDTVMLYHFDEGDGGTARDAAGTADLALTSVTWQAFSLPEGDEAE